MLDVEAEFEGRPDAAEAVCSHIRAAVGDDYPLCYSTFAIARYHRSFPYDIFERYCSATLPQVYYNAFGWTEELSLRWTYEDYASLGIPAERVFPVVGVYREGSVGYPSAGSLANFVSLAKSHGSGGISFWSFEHMDESMWQAVADLPFGQASSTPGECLAYHPLHLTNDAFWGRTVDAALEPAKLSLQQHFGLPRDARYADLLIGVSSPAPCAYVALYDPPGGWPQLVGYVSAQCPGRGQHSARQGKALRRRLPTLGYAPERRNALRVHDRSGHVRVRY